MSVDSSPVPTREEMVPYKHMQNLAKLYLLVRRTPLLQRQYGKQKLVLKLDDGITYQAGYNLEQQKEQLKTVVK